MGLRAQGSNFGLAPKQDFTKSSLWALRLHKSPTS